MFANKIRAQDVSLGDSVEHDRCPVEGVYSLVSSCHGSNFVEHLLLGFSDNNACPRKLGDGDRLLWITD